MSVPSSPYRAFDAVRALVRSEPLPSPADLLTRLDAYREELRLAVGRNEFLDTALGDQLDRACRALIERWDTFGAGASQAESRALVAATVIYFVTAADADHDFDSLLGFEDDLDVVRWVFDALGLGEFAP